MLWHLAVLTVSRDRWQSHRFAGMSLVADFSAAV